MNSLDKRYKEIVSNIIDNGVLSGDRTGTGTIKIFGNEFRHKMSDGFPLLTTKKMFYKGIIKELLWFLKGSTNIKELVDDGVNIWIGDCYKKYVNYMNNIPIGSTVDGRFVIPQSNTEQAYRSMTREEFIEAIKKDKYFAEQFGDLGKVYGAQWVNWDGKINQIKELVDTLKTNPDSRRMLVTAWNPSDVHNVILPPCHYAFQVITRELIYDERCNYFNSKYTRTLSFFPPGVPISKSELDINNIPKRTISLLFNMRSVDVALGLPFDIASYGFLLSMIAQCVNMVPDELICYSADTHIYLNQIDGIKQQLNNEAYELPALKLWPAKDIFSYRYEDFEIEGYKSHDAIKMPLSN